MIKDLNENIFYELNKSRKRYIAEHLSNTIIDSVVGEVTDIIGTNSINIRIDFGKEKDKEKFLKDFPILFHN